MVTAERIKLAAQAIHARGRAINVSHAIYNIIATLLAIARHHLRLPESEIQAIKAMKARVKPVSVGMTAKNSMRLDQFNDFQNVVRLLGPVEI